MIIRLLASLAVFCVLAGCEWKSSGSGDSFNNNISANVSGTYRDAAGGFLVRTPGLSDPQTTTSTIGTGDGGQASFGGDISSNPVQRGSVSVTDGNETLVDTGGGSLQSTGGLGFGSIDYETGAISATFQQAPAAGASIVVTFAFFAPGSPENPSSGKSGNPVFVFNVRQNGNRMEITDDYGDTYLGRIEDPFTDSDSGSPAALVSEDGSAISGEEALQQNLGLSYPFELSGTSAGNPIRIVGTVKAEVTIFYALVRETNTGQNNAFTQSSTTDIREITRQTNYRMVATWIEEANGKSASINAVGPSDQGISIVNDPSELAQ